MVWKLGEERKTLPPKQPFRYPPKLETLEQKRKMEATRQLVNSIFDLWLEDANGNNRN